MTVKVVLFSLYLLTYILDMVAVFLSGFQSSILLEGMQKLLVGYFYIK